MLPGLVQHRSLLCKPCHIFISKSLACAWPRLRSSVLPLSFLSWVVSQRLAPRRLLSNGRRPSTRSAPRISCPRALSPFVWRISATRSTTASSSGSNDGVSFEQFAGALQTDGEAALRLTTLEGGPGAIDPQRTSQVTLDLEPGNYVLACFVPDASGVPHVAKGMLKPLQVTTAELPSSTAPDVQDTFAMRDFSFEIPATLPAGVATYQVVNGGQQPHELDVVKLAPGKTEDDLLGWDAAPSGPPPFASVGGLNGLSAGATGYMTLDLEPGTYVAVCHIPDPGSGVPHLHLGMFKRFTVPG